EARHTGGVAGAHIFKVFGDQRVACGCGSAPRDLPKNADEEPETLVVGQLLFDLTYALIELIRRRCRRVFCGRCHGGLLSPLGLGELPASAPNLLSRCPSARGPGAVSSSACASR